MLCFPSSVEIAARPRGHWPAVVVLPEKRSHTIWHIATVRFDGGLDGIALKQLAEIQGFLEIARFAVFAFQVPQNAVVCVASSALMRHHNLRMYVVVLNVRCKLHYALHIGEGLEAVFGEKAASYIVECCDFTFGLPNTPVVSVAIGIPKRIASFGLAVRISIKWRRRHIKPIVVFFNHFGKRNKVAVGVLLHYELGNSVAHCVVSSLISPTVPRSLTFVVAAPQRNARVVAQTHHIVDGFLAHIFKHFALGGIKTACEHKVLPYKDSVLVAQVVENVVLVDSSTPHAQHIHVGVHCIKYCAFVHRIGNICKETMLRNVVRTFHKRLYTIDLHGVRCSKLILFAQNLNVAQTNVFATAVGCASERNACGKMI